MDHQCNTVRLYTAQGKVVLEAITKDGVCFSKADYVRRKYGESAAIFLTVYEWFVSKAEVLVPKPNGAQFPYWAFANTMNVDTSGGGHFLTLDVPKDQVIYFDMYDWIKILQLSFIGENEKEEKDFKQRLSLLGVQETQIMLTGFYPELKKEIYESWNRLFRNHESILAGDCGEVESVQTALWQIKKEWLVSL